MDKESFRTKDEQEVAGCALVCSQIYDHFENIQLTENMIKITPTWLLQHANKDERRRGEYKKIPIQIKAFETLENSLGVLFETTSPLKTLCKMQ